jgi:hypothetical protein
VIAKLLTDGGKTLSGSITFSHGRIYVGVTGAIALGSLRKRNKSTDLYPDFYFSKIMKT